MTSTREDASSKAEAILKKGIEVTPALIAEAKALHAEAKAAVKNWKKDSIRLAKLLEEIYSHNLHLWAIDWPKNERPTFIVYVTRGLGIPRATAYRLLAIGDLIGGENGISEQEAAAIPPQNLPLRLDQAY